jgi:NADH-quinone oxidoreductase subunit G
VSPLAQLADAVLAGATFAEKAGCYVNADGRRQYAEAALPPRDGSMPDLDILTILTGRGAGPVRSREVLAELATVVPAFAAAEGGVVPVFGVRLGEPAAVAAGAVPFNDPWTVTHYLKHDV